jgi:hypothetical protein
MLSDDAMTLDRTVEERPAAAKPDALATGAIPAQPAARDEPSQALRGQRAKR